ncbi:MAG: hypothetical protein HYY63_00495 [Elusimicrobia bacterium]|nr:hypothetical protein [Elusimicrobiota bacterium]
MNQRTHIVIPQELVHQIDLLVGKRKRSSFLIEAAFSELKRLRQMKALSAVAGAWKNKYHPELIQNDTRYHKMKS